MTRRRVVMEISRMEASHLSDLVLQFVELLEGSTESGDPAVARLTPDAYPDDAEASAEFRHVTRVDLLERRQDDGRVVLASLANAGGDDDAVDRVTLDPDTVASWLRTLTALRLVIAERLGIAHEDNTRDTDPRFGVYDWLGYRLDVLVRAASPIEG